MIIQIRGTSGSGKSTVMRAIMEQVGGTWEKHYETPRSKRPAYYTNGSLLVMGHYEIACGGCDTIGSAKQTYAKTRELMQQFPTAIILQEGLLVSEDVIWTEQYGEAARVLFLTTSQDECLRRVNARQQEAGRTAADPARVIRKLTTRVGTIERARLRLVDAGIHCQRCPSEQAPSVALRWIRQGSR